MTEPLIRVASVDDREELEALIDVCYSIIYPGWYDEDILNEALPAMLRIDPKLLESGRYFSATIDGRLAGCGGWSVSPPVGGTVSGTGHIRHFATHPDFMRKGVGSAILIRCIKEASSEGVEKLQCFSSHPGEPFYAQHGFSTREPVTIMMGEGVAFPALLMERELGG
ncbi:MAG: GNAT family N-acetyltransferase [Rhizobiaceae bacterium]